MKTLPKILCLCSVLFLTGCDYIFPSTWNYRITVEIETPEGIKSGSTVRQVVAQLQPKITPETHPISYRLYGEAVVIDLGERGVVFALINWDSYREVYEAFPKSFKTSAERIHYYSHLKPGTKAELKNVRARPKLVMFTNMNDAKSVKPVYYGKMEEILGDGVRLKSIMIEMMNDPVSLGVIDKIAPEGFEKLNIGYYKFKKGEL